MFISQFIIVSAASQSVCREFRKIHVKTGSKKKTMDDSCQ